MDLVIINNFSLSIFELVVRSIAQYLSQVWEQKLNRSYKKECKTIFTNYRSWIVTVANYKFLPTSLCMWLNYQSSLYESIFFKFSIINYFNIWCWRFAFTEQYKSHFLFCTMTNKCTIISQIITLLHVSTLSCHPQGACNQYLAKLHKYFKCSCW
jgi:hypothetical protein